jgi:hypothetical protein
LTHHVVVVDATGGEADCEAAARPAIGVSEEKEDEGDMAPSAERPLASLKEMSFMVVQSCSKPVCRATTKGLHEMQQNKCKQCNMQIELSRKYKQQAKRSTILARNKHQKMARRRI